MTTYKIFLSTLFFLIFNSSFFAQPKLVNAFPHLTFTGAVGIYSSPDNTGRLFVLEQNGIIKVFQNDSSSSAAKTFLDITGKVTGGGEKGLLGLAFHPDFKSNGYFYLDYTTTNNGRLQTHISRFKVSASNQDSADTMSEQVLITQDQPYENHNGGQLAFGPDNYLYIAFGDGGSGGDPDGNGQNRQVLLGKILRIDVDNTRGSLNYSIPPDNPFINNSNGYREEVFAYGLRNPWRFSFDSLTNILWCADVGQGTREEIDLIENGKNYGWNIMEGKHCYNSGSCNSTGLTLPVWEYDHSDGNCSVTGGFVYHGSRVPELQGKYIFGDYCSRKISALTLNPGNDTSATILDTAAANITSFGTDSNEELYVVCANGKIYTFDSKTTGTGGTGNYLPREFSLFQNFPNPFNPTTIIKYSIPKAGYVRLTVYDAAGKFVKTLIDDLQSAGEHFTTWDGLNNFNLKVSSGVYIYRLVSGDLARARSMLLLK